MLCDLMIKNLKIFIRSKNIFLCFAHIIEPPYQESGNKTEAIYIKSNNALFSVYRGNRKERYSAIGLLAS